jgi:ketosteroid isomerase-like protein
MKRDTLIKSTLLAFSSLALVTLALAQDEPSTPPAGDNPPAPSLEAPSSLRDTSPTPTSTPERRATPAAETTPKASASPAASPSKSASPSTERKRARTDADEEETTPSRSNQNAAASTGPDRGSPESNVKRLENQWEGSVKAHDVSFLQARVAEDFIGVSSRGKRLNKSSLMKEFKTDTDTYASAKNSGIIVRVIDKDVVVASGVAKEVGKSHDGKSFKRSYIFTDTWAMRGDRWQCVASHVMVEGAK